VTGPRIGLVGCGEWGRLILRDLRSLGCEVAVVARSALSVARAREGGASAVVAVADALPEVHGVVVATPSARHAESVESVLERGVPVFVEKPLSTAVGDARRLVARAPDRIFVMEKWRYHPGIEALRDVVRERLLGPVRGLATLRVQWGSRHTDVDAVWVLAPHDLSIAREVLGFIPEPKAALGEGRGGRLDGIIGQLGESPWMSLEISSRHAASRREVRLHCEAGTAILDGAYATHLTILRAGPGPAQAHAVEQAIPTELPLLRELRAFVQHLGGGPPPRSSARDGLAVVEAIQRLRELAGSG
jgi:predicted dehydrogenase